MLSSTSLWITLSYKTPFSSSVIILTKKVYNFVLVHMCVVIWCSAHLIRKQSEIVNRTEVILQHNNAWPHRARKTWKDGCAQLRGSTIAPLLTRLGTLRLSLRNKIHVKMNNFCFQKTINFIYGKYLLFLIDGRVSYIMLKTIFNKLYIFSFNLFNTKKKVKPFHYP